MFRPRFLLYDNHPDPVSLETGPHFARQSPRVDHLDIVKIWKGLSSDKAEELLFWEITFKKSLEELLRSQLEFLQQDPGISSIIYPEPGLDATNTPICDRFHYLPISLVDIVNAMIVCSKQRHRHHRRQEGLRGVDRISAELDQGCAMNPNTKRVKQDETNRMNVE